ncbi:MAG: hypothetical protein KatS3mg031_1086 [Chitinophagales bacterium]|nr:MAG: hypothetical protein KatS3mg031_1086 [Chitinophagales bacterium]
MLNSSRNKALAFIFILLLPLSFFLYFEVLKQKTGVRIKELPHLSTTALPPFQLLAHTGDTITEKQVLGKIAVADFFFTRCRGICPIMSNQMKAVQDYLIKQPNLKSEFVLLSHTVDPYYDSLQVLQDYAATYGAVDSVWLFVTGEKAQLYSLAKDFYKVPTLETPEDSLNPYAHSERFILLDKEGFIRGYYDGTDSASVKELMKDIVLLDLAYQIESSKPKKK